MTEIAIGQKVQALTTTRCSMRVVVEVTSIASQDASGTYVWGYRVRASRRPRQTSYPQLYFVPSQEG